MASKKIKGRIIRILDTKTVVINLGLEHGIGDESLFFILGEPESVIDPVTNEVLGTVKVTKARVKASQVFDKFTIATTSWKTVTYNRASVFGDLFRGMETETIDEGALKVIPGEVKPWKAKSESPVKVGDEVEVAVEEPEKEEEPATTQSQSEGT
ncbi:MAG TPA: hypothetical protein VFQ47_00100 [Nitrososphaera sp.]|jgi:membrane-bound ClpP family serine protease|nr:hypothetical protein [Nitrososphaera sp.]